MSLFEPNQLFAELPADASRPLAERMRPRSLEEYVGQEHILGPGKPLRVLIESDRLASMVFWGPPGVGKTSLARVIARHTRCDFVPFSAVTSGIKEVKTVMAEAEHNRKAGRRTVLFVDEIHRFNKSQQDAFLPYVEKGDVILIGATTENPSFEVISALLSRAKVYTLRALNPEEVVVLLRRALQDKERGFGEKQLAISDEQLQQLAIYANGDARAAYAALELAVAAAQDGVVPPQVLEDVIQRKILLYDKAGEEHFNLISALHKSVRSSDPDAAVYWLARMLESGEDRRYLARRLMRMAIEDVGLADPRALEQSVATQQAVHFMGSPEGDQALAQLTIYLSLAPKSDAAYAAFNAASEKARKALAEPVPLHLRNAPTRLMKDLGYSEGYQHAHASESGLAGMECLPPNLAGTRFYKPTNRGVEARIGERLAEIRKWKEEQRS
ncbi:MAG TPA: replication-associated recombination protein A [Bryobacteraceae bacterium]|nr:replication-associated recombination protein A [Bryobacteraceae bacterium]